jgi:anti-sigma factor RsiW
MEQLAEYLDDDVHADLRRAVDQHLHTCTNCSYYVDTVRKTVVLYQADQRIEVPMKATTRLRAALEAEYAASPRKPARPAD